MIFTPDLSKQAQEVIFSRKINKIIHPTTTFNTVPLPTKYFNIDYIYV